MALESINLVKGVNYTFVPSDCFKTTYIAFNILTPLKKETAAANALAAALMKSETSEHPDLYSLNRKLASLYGATAFSWASKSGDWQEITIGILVNDSRFSLDNEDTVTEAAKLLNDMVLNRYFSKKSFSDSAIEREKRLLTEKIEGNLNDKRIYARNRCVEKMCEGEPFGLSADGTVESVTALTSDDINLAIENLIKTAFISVMVVGAKEPLGFKEQLSDNFKKVERDYKELPLQIECTASNPIKTSIDKMQVNQGKLVLGLRGKALPLYKTSVAARIMCDIFGGGPYSKLFCILSYFSCIFRNCRQSFVKRTEIFVTKHYVVSEKFYAQYLCNIKAFL